jgi:hypothetical protein
VAGLDALLDEGAHIEASGSVDYSPVPIVPIYLMKDIYTCATLPIRGRSDDEIGVVVVVLDGYATNVGTLGTAGTGAKKPWQGKEKLDRVIAIMRAAADAVS